MVLCALFGDDDDDSLPFTATIYCLKATLYFSVKPIEPLSSTLHVGLVYVNYRDIFSLL